MKYTPSYFSKSMPEWKKKKDPLITRFFYRKVSFVFSSFCAEFGISANAVSYFSALIAIFSAVSFLIHTHISCILGAVLINVWAILDCVDGNLARSVKKQKYGEFADAFSSYILVAFVVVSMGYASFYMGGFLIEMYVPEILLLGALASIFDPLMRLCYQKFKNSSQRETLNEMGYEGTTIKKKIEETLGMGGILPVIILICSILNILDIAVLYCFFMYGGIFILAIFGLIKKTFIKNK